MKCLKCGREIEGQRVFCEECLKGMEDCPVKPGTPVVLPRHEPQIRRTPIRTQPKPEEVIRDLKKTIRSQRIIMAVGTILFLAAIAVLGCLLYQAMMAHSIGSNYTTIPTVQ